MLDFLIWYLFYYVESPVLCCDKLVRCRNKTYLLGVRTKSSFGLKYLFWWNRLSCGCLEVWLKQLVCWHKQTRCPVQTVGFLLAQTRLAIVPRSAWKYPVASRLQMFKLQSLSKNALFQCFAKEHVFGCDVKGARRWKHIPCWLPTCKPSRLGC